MANRFKTEAKLMLLIPLAIVLIGLIAAIVTTSRLRH
jgi:hypothetical protein